MAAVAAAAVGQLSPPAGEERRGGERGQAAARLGSLDGRLLRFVRSGCATRRTDHRTVLESGRLRCVPATRRPFGESRGRIAREAPEVKVGGGRRQRCYAEWHATGSEPVRCFFKCASSEGDVASPPPSSPFVASVGDAREKSSQREDTERRNKKKRSPPPRERE